MKRITTLLLAVAFALGSVGAAFADNIDIKVKGQWDFAFGWIVGGGFGDSIHRQTADRDDDAFIARHRVRTQINFITSEYLEAVLMFEIGNLNWGGGGNGTVGRGSGAGLDADGVNIETKRAYLNWIIPGTETSVRMGIQGLALPSTPMGPVVFAADVAGVVVNTPIDDMFELTAFWLRPFDAQTNDENRGRHMQDEVDAFGLLLPVKGDGWSVTPWFMYSFIGSNSGFYEYLILETNYANMSKIDSHTRAWWLGTHFQMDIVDNLSFNLEAIYGSLHKADVGNAFGTAGVNQHAYESNVGTSGWFVGATLDYTIDGFGVPGIFGWWASGDDEDAARTGKLGRLPILGNDTGGFAPTSFGAAGSAGIGTDTMILGSGVGTWGLGIQIADMSFIEDLSHTLRFAYYRGTNDSELLERGDFATPFRGAGDLYLTDNDYVWEVNFDHTYKIYENFNAIVELGYLHLNVDEDTWGRANNDQDSSTNAWKAQLLFQYTF